MHPCLAKQFLLKRKKTLKLKDLKNKDVLGMKLYEGRGLIIRMQNDFKKNHTTCIFEAKIDIIISDSKNDRYISTLKMDVKKEKAEPVLGNGA